jgi:hypothetical protein
MAAAAINACGRKFVFILEMGRVPLSPHRLFEYFVFFVVKSRNTTPKFIACARLCQAVQAFARPRGGGGLRRSQIRHYSDPGRFGLF